MQVSIWRCYCRGGRRCEDRHSHQPSPHSAKETGPVIPFIFGQIRASASKGRQANYFYYRENHGCNHLLSAALIPKPRCARKAMTKVQGFSRLDLILCSDGGFSPKSWDSNQQKTGVHKSAETVWRDYQCHLLIGKDVRVCLDFKQRASCSATENRAYVLTMSWLKIYSQLRGLCGFLSLT